jgi:CO/xanthine dehydrogenase FAD-binding subunit
MTPFEYLLPKTMEEALEYLKGGVPLAGGTGLTPQRNQLKTVVDLKNLGLDDIKVEGDIIEIGATTKLQKIVQTGLELPEMLREVCKLETGWNMRNRATIGGTIMSSDGRSPILTALLALDAQITLEPDSILQSLDDLLDCREDVKLITHIRFQKPSALLYEQVSRSPADFAIVCVALASWNEGGEVKHVISIGGHGLRPLRLRGVDLASGDKHGMIKVSELARNAYVRAEDQWASAEYRSEVAAILVQRLLGQVIS